jgi:hypothetical protein
MFLIIAFFKNFKIVAFVYFFELFNQEHKFGMI